MILLGLLLTLPVLIVVHEYGHYRMARWCGVRVLRFSVGFGPTLWQRRRGDTEFVVAAVPLGGYVRMLDHRESPVPPALAHEAFDRQPLHRRAAIVAAGPLINLALAVMLYAAAHWIGTQEPMARVATPPAHSLAAEGGLAAGDWVRAVSDGDGQWQDVLSMSDLQWKVTEAVLRGQDLQLQVSDADGTHRRMAPLRLSALAGAEMDAQTLQRIGLGAAFRSPVVVKPAPGGPAERAGLKEGDEVLSIDGRPTIDAQALIDLVRAHASTDRLPMRWVVQRQGERLELEVVPRVVREGETPIGRVDAAIGGAPRLVMVRLGPWEGLTRGAQRMVEMAGLSLKMVGRMLTGQSSLRHLSGPLTIGDYAGQSIRLGPSYYLAFLAMVSVSLGVLNLLPLPMLDGGHLMYYLFEGVTGRPVSELWHKWLQRSGAIILLLMMTIALSNDVARQLGLQ